MDFDDLLLNTVRLFTRAPRRARALPDPVHPRPHRRVPGHQRRAERPGRPAGRRAPQHRGGGGQRPVGLPVPGGRHHATSSSSSRPSPTPRSSPSTRTSAPPRPSSTPPTRSSPTTSPASRRPCGPTAARASRSSATGPRTSTTRRRGWPTRSAGSTASRACDWGDVAVFYRTNAQSRALEEAMVRAEVPYKVVGGTKFYDRREVKDVMAYLRVLVNPDDEVSWRRIVNVPKRGVGETSVKAGRLGRAGRACPSGTRCAQADEAGVRRQGRPGPASAVRAARRAAVTDGRPRPGRRERGGHPPGERGRPSRTAAPGRPARWPAPSGPASWWWPWSSAPATAASCWPREPSRRWAGWRTSTSWPAWPTSTARWPSSSRPPRWSPTPTSSTGTGPRSR